MKSVSKTFFVKLADIYVKAWFLTLFIQIYINCLKSFLVEDRTKAKVELRPKKKFPNGKSFDLKFDPTKLAAELVAKPCKKLWQYSIMIRIE